jgi:hypothetical protein
MKIEFAPDIDLTAAEYKKLRRWLKRKYHNLSEVSITRTMVKELGDQGGWHNRHTWSKKEVQRKVSNFTELYLMENMPSETQRVLPESVYQHVVARVAAHKVIDKPFRLHRCLGGSEKRGLAGHCLIVSTTTGGAYIKRDAIYRLWQRYSCDEAWRKSLHSVGEYWKYGRIKEKIGIRRVWIEVWFDERPFRPMAHLVDRDTLIDKDGLRRRAEQARQAKGSDPDP